MILEKTDQLFFDVEAVRQIPVVPLMLDVICRTTGMGFAAVARVTDDRWVACCVQDEIGFGLKPGGELKVQTTICDEIRDSGTEVVIDHVEKSDQFRDHHTPAMYGFQSYISFPIVLKTGEFFGTLCAIDPKPAKLNDPKIIGMFKMFAELLSFHLQTMDIMERSTTALKESNRKLQSSDSEINQYKHISNHNLKEPLRKISVFSDMLLSKQITDEAKITSLLTRISGFAQEATSMLEHISEFSDLKEDTSSFENVELNDLIDELKENLSTAFAKKNITLNRSELPAIYAVPVQMQQLFYHLTNHFVTFSQEDSVIQLYSNEVMPDRKEHLLSDKFQYREFCVEVQAPGNGKYKVENIFDVFLHLNDSTTSNTFAAGLAFCKKIVNNHGGTMNARTKENNNTLLSVILPISIAN